MNNKKSSKKIAGLASKTLQNDQSSKAAKKLAGSVLSQSRTTNQTGSKMEDFASTVLKSNKYSSNTKTLAGSVLSQSNKKR
ncbi:MAG TPA: hypothetical protein ENH91_05655 [Leeuwenhoekiella sp.]|nr:hypothetical protein [Leeuwenhoekiella sp.]